MWLRYSKWILSSSTNPSLRYLQSIQQFRTQISRNPLKGRTKRSIKNFDESNVLHVEPHNELRPTRLLIRPTVFTVGFVGCSFVTCAIWQYESQRNKLRKLKERWQSKLNSDQISSQLKNIWRDVSEPKRVVGTIIGLNLLVFLAWRVKRLEPFMLKYFTSSPFKPNLSSMVLSTFSHYNGIHFLCNMYVLWSFHEPIVRMFGKEQFTAVYLSSGVVSSWLSYVFKAVTKTPNISLGASGSIMALLGAVCTQFPDAQLAIIFLPFFTFSAKSALIAMVSFDLLGTIMRWRYLDHSAHLGGVLFGIFYVKYGYKTIWESLTPNGTFTAMTSGGTTNSAVPGAVAPDGGWGWIIVLASFMIHFIMDGITYSMGEVFLHPMRSRLGEGRGLVSGIYGVLPAITLGVGPIATIFVNTYGCRLVTIVGASIAAVGFLASYFWANIWFYYLTIAIIGGIGFGMIYLPAIVSVGYYFEAKRSFAMGIAVCGSGLGTLAFPLVMPYIINKPLWFDYDGALLLEAGIISICVIFGALMVPLSTEASEIRRREKKARAEQKRLALQSGTITNNPFDEQQSQLLPKAKESEIALRTVSPNTRESTAVVPSQQQFSSDDVEQPTSPYRNDLTEKIRPEDDTANPSVVLSRKDALYQGSLPNIPLYNENTDEYHNQIITTSDVVNKPRVKKSFLGQIAEQIDLNLLKDAAFALFAISNFLTSLGFNVPYNFANDLAT
ncbi:unnamed protein product, partial [Adineta ricciae]